MQGQSEIDRLLDESTVNEDAATPQELKRNHTLRTGGNPKGRRKMCIRDRMGAVCFLLSSSAVHANELNKSDANIIGHVLDKNTDCLLYTSRCV